MPIHDWTRVIVDVYHDFHCAWIAHIAGVLNQGVLPSGYYALIERAEGAKAPSDSAIAAFDVQTAAGLMEIYARRRNRVGVHHVSDDRVIAFLEIVSPGNKGGRHALRSFVGKAAAALTNGIHLLLIDLFPPDRRDPRGIHGAVWEELGESYSPPADKPLTLAAYSAGFCPTAYVEPVAVGDVQSVMPLFLTPDDYIPVGLEATYLAAWRGLPKKWREALEAPTGSGPGAGAP